MFNFLNVYTEWVLKEEKVPHISIKRDISGDVISEDNILVDIYTRKNKITGHIETKKEKV